MNQETALAILKTGKNVFLTGSAGAGKTYLLNRYIEYLRDRDVGLAITASTGIAATHLNGMTIHSWSGIGIRDELTDEDLEKIAKKAPTRKRIEKTKVLIIDEISMLSGALLGCVDQILRFFKDPFLPFGGIQVVLSGDFFQLPPVSREPQMSHEKFAFMHPSWVESNLQICYLTEQHRQGTDHLLTLLNEIRSGEVTDSSIDLLMEKMEASQNQENEGLKLYTHNADVDRINAKKLEELDEELQLFKAQIEGVDLLVQALRKSVIVPEDLHLKKGAQVIFAKNNYDEGYVNGTMGTIMDYTVEGYPIVETFDDRKLVAKPADWSIDDETGKPIAIFKQIPLRLAWAITVHKSQGMTLDSATVDLSKTFEPGQGYVALSRVREFGGLFLIGCNNRAFQMDGLVMKADKRFQELSLENVEVIKKFPQKELESVFDQFIVKCGGIIDQTQIELNHQTNKQPKVFEKKEKKSTYEQTKELILLGKNLAEIAIERDLGENTIIGHLKKLMIEDPMLNFSLFRPEESIIEAINTAEKACQEKAIDADYDKDGKLKLGLIHRELKGAYDYDVIKLARIFL